MLVPALALCDWSELQKTRRQVARLYCSPRLSSLHYDTLTRVAATEVGHFLDRVASMTATSMKATRAGQPATVHIKPLIQAACANIFSGYMCSTRFSYDDTAFVHIVRLFDEIFWEINQVRVGVTGSRCPRLEAWPKWAKCNESLCSVRLQGYAVDFLPWLAPCYRRHMGKLSSWAMEIRSFILTRIMDEHRRRLVEGEDGELDMEMARDFTDALLIQLQEDPHLEWQHIIFELEDFLGGHSAVGNLTMLSLAAVVSILLPACRACSSKHLSSPVLICVSPSFAGRQPPSGVAHPGRGGLRDGRHPHRHPGRPHRDALHRGRHPGGAARRFLPHRAARRHAGHYHCR